MRMSLTSHLTNHPARLLCGKYSKLQKEYLSTGMNRAEEETNLWRTSSPYPHCQQHLLPTEYGAAPMAQREAAESQMTES
jgi:endonuclease/exonuclease/phosphatase family metal-dependent hydrolase